ncbi:MAG TPA: ferric reductase-like transmembrane domain-containing protein [Acidothermaceae bacterium]|jgi:sulfoxide reductase heme-binding subunit YedZ|nr:ferric reductase-like transmembrane domain-containing protein [Acidothermaceae bacterium]
MTTAQIDTALWDLGRATGVISLALFTIVVVLGIVTRSGRPLPGLPRFAVSAVHRAASLLAVTFLGVHIVTLTLDPQSKLRWLDSVIPIGSHFRPLWIGLGAAAFDLIIALIVTSLLRHRIGRRTWRAIHWTAYAMWPFAMLHTIGAGTDARAPWLLWVLVGCGVAVFAALGWRTSAGFLDDTDRVTGTRIPSALTRPDRPVTVGQLTGTRGQR